jgi:hypothetical protein
MKFIIVRSANGNRGRAEVRPGMPPPAVMCPVARREIALHQGGALRLACAFG